MVTPPFDCVNCRGGASVIETWLERWQEGRIGWHEPEGNRSLQKYWRASGCRVLVPLCGKARDVLWLEERGNAVTGVELSDIAAQAFFVENDIDYKIEAADMPRYVATDRDIVIVEKQGMNDPVVGLAG